MRRACALLVAVLLALLIVSCGKDTAEKRLPDVTLHGFDGQADVDLGTFKGPAVVNLWASWCGPCKRELPLYADFARAYSGTVSVLGIDWQETTSSAAREMLKKSDVDYPVVLDPDGKLRVPGLPKLILVDAEGKIAYSEYVEIKSVGQLESLVAKHLGVRK